MCLLCMYLQQWTDGSKPERSKRIKNKIFKYTTSINELPIQTNQTHDITSNALDFSLSSPSKNQFVENNYPEHTNDPKESMYFKMAERDMISQTGRNPFFFNSNSYVDQVSLQDKFLKPKSTINVDKTCINTK